MFMELSNSIVNASNHTKCVSLGNSKCIIQTTLINWHPNKYSQEFHYYPFTFKLDRNALNDLSNKACVSQQNGRFKSKHVQHNYRNKWIENISKHISCQSKHRFDGRKCNSDRRGNNDKCLFECKKRNVCEIYHIWSPGTGSCENGKYLASIMDDLGIMCDEIIESYDQETKTIPKSFHEKKAICKTQDLYILLAFLLITEALLIAVSIYCYFIKYQPIQKLLLPIHVINNELKEILY